MPMSIYALAATDLQANGIIVALGGIGFLVDDLSLLLGDADPLIPRAHDAPRQPSARPASAGGRPAGPAIGGALGWITGIGRLTVPGLGPCIAAGPIKALLDGTVLGALEGGLASALGGLGLPHAGSHHYAGRIRAGRILIVANSDKGAWIDKARQALRDAGAEDIGCSGEEPALHASATDGVAPPGEGVLELGAGAPGARAGSALQEGAPG